MRCEFTEFKPNGVTGWAKGILPAFPFTPFSQKAIVDGTSYEKEHDVSDRVIYLDKEWDYVFESKGLTELDPDVAYWMKKSVPCPLQEGETFQPLPEVKKLFGKKERGANKPQAFYHTEFSCYDAQVKRYFLHLGDVSGCMEVFVNGKCCGLSCLGEADIDITPAVVAGQNDLLVALSSAQVLREKGLQKEKAYGIFGSAYISVRPANFLQAYTFQSRRDGVFMEGSLQLHFETVSDFSVAISLVDGGRIVSSAKVSGKTEVSVVLRDVFKEYTPGNPSTYDIYVQTFENGTETECVRFPIAFIDMRETENGFLIAGAPFTVRATAYVPSSDLEKDLDAVKSCHFNAIEVNRPSYALLQACLRKGLFVVDKADEMADNSDKTFSSDLVYDYVLAVATKEMAQNKGSSALLFHLACGKGAVAKGFTDASGFTGKKVVGVGNDIVLSARAENYAYKTYLLGASPSDLFMPLVVGGTVSFFGALFDENGITEIGKACRNTFCPLQAKYYENRRLEIFNASYYASFDFTLLAREAFGPSLNDLKEFTVHLDPRTTTILELYINKFCAGLELQLIYKNLAGTVLSEQSIPVQPVELVNPAQMAQIKCKDYTYQFKDLGNTLAENTLPARSYFVPCSQERVCDATRSYSQERMYSDRMFSLSGEWEFLYCGNKIPTDLTPSAQKFDTVRLPSSWESDGYEPLTFEQGYPFDLEKKDLERSKKSKNTVAVYRKVVNISDLSFLHILSVEGISGQLTVYVNGKYVGGTCYTSGQFLLSSYLVMGENEIIFLLRKWSPRSFLVGQHFSATGLLGEINLIKCRPCSLRDYTFSVGKKETEYFTGIDLTFFSAPDNVKIIVKKDGDILFESVQKGSEEMRFNFSGNFLPYNSEDPQLYDVYVKVYEKDFLTECTRLKTEIQSRRREADILYYNDIRVRVKGVVYNPVYNANGKLTTQEERKRDLLLMRKYGFNTIETTFEPSGEFLRLCQEYGIFVIYRFPIDPSVAEKNKRDWEKKDCLREYVQEQIRLCVEKTKGFHNILMYLFDGKQNGTVQQVYGVLARETDAFLSFVGENSDVTVLKNPSLAKFFEANNANMQKKPLFLSEYAESFGVGYADIRQFENTMDDSTCCLGGCMKQFCDDIVGTVGGTDNGLFTQDRKPCTGVECIKYLYRTIRCEIDPSDPDSIIIHNLNKYKNTADYILKINIQRNGETLSDTEISAVIPPDGSRKFDFFRPHATGDMFVNVEVCDRESKEVLYVEQIPLSRTLQKIEVESKGNRLETRDMPDFLEINFAGGTVVFDKRVGAITHYSLYGKEILKADSIQKGGNACRTNIYRPFVRNILSGGDKYQSKKDNFVWKRDGSGKIDIRIQTSLYQGKKQYYVIQDRYLVSSDGTIEVKTVLNPMQKRMEHLDCFGKQFRLFNKFNIIRYYGNGEKDAYCDMDAHTRVGAFGIDVNGVFDSLALKQECGNRKDVHYVICTDAESEGIMIMANETPFQMRVSPYSDAEIGEMYLHPEKQIEQSGVYLNIDACVCGIGRENGGTPLPQHTLISKQVTFAFTLLPLSNGK